MPLPWKKNGVTRISQIVADFQKPKRGGSLVVQTGFPTSLVDLFVKNRDRLRKPSKKHKKNKNKNGSDDRVTDPISTTSDMGSSHSTISVRPSSPKVENLIPKEGDHAVEENGFRLSADMGETHVENRVVDAEKCVGGGDWSVVLLSVLKVFAVVVLALSTKKLAVGITLSAFLLIFLEFVGKHLVCRLKPCSKPKAALQSVAQRVSASPLVLKGVDESEDKKGEIVQEKTEAVLFELLDIEIESDSSNEEPNNNSGRDCIDSTASQVTLLEFLSADDKKWKVVGDGEDGDESKGGKIKFSKSAKIKAKLVKKFVSKKLRRKSKKHGSEPFSDVSSYTGDDEAEGSEEQQDQKDAIPEEQEERKDSIQEEQESENMSLLSLNAEEKCEKQGADGVSDHGSETSLIVEKKEGGRKGNCGYLILFLVVLTGLFGGRIVALLLTIPCCFMLELLED